MTDDNSLLRAKQHQLTPIVIRGSHRDVGYRLGELAKDCLPLFFQQSSTWTRLQRWKNSALLEILKSNTITTFPYIWEELRGISEGANVELNDILLWNCRGDLVDKCNDGCTTVVYSEASRSSFICHNEDGDPYLYNKCFIVDVTFTDSDQASFLSFYYPGSVPGHAFAMNEHGLVQTINSLRVKGEVNMTAVSGATLPRMVLSRAVINCSSAEGPVYLLSQYSAIGAFHYNLCSPAVGGADMKSVEHTSWGCSVKNIEEYSPSCHANHITHSHPAASSLVNNAENIISLSSMYRQNAAVAMSESIKCSDASASTLASHFLSITSFSAFNPAFLPPLPSALPEGDAKLLSVLRCNVDDLDEEYTLATALFRISPLESSTDTSLRIEEIEDGPIVKYSNRNGVVELFVFDMCERHR